MNQELRIKKCCHCEESRACRGATRQSDASGVILNAVKDLKHRLLPPARGRGRNDSEGGYVALMSVIIISLILLGLTAILSTTSFFTRFNILDRENKKISLGLAEACVQVAMVNLAKDVGYGSAIPSAGNQITISPDKTCRICSVSISSPYSIVTRAVYNGAHTNLIVVGTLTSTNFTVNEWDEQGTYSGSCVVP